MALKKEEKSEPLILKVKEENASVEEDIDAHISNLQQQIENIEKEQEASERVSSSALTNSDASYWQKKRETDLRSVYVGQIDYSVTPEELATLMGVAGVVNRVTLLTDKWTGYPKGSGYVEYESLLSASKALKLNQVVYRGRFLRIEQKRTNVPWFIASRYGGYDAIPFGLNGRVAGATRQGLQARAWFTHTVGQNRFVPYSKPQPAGKAA